MSDTEFEELLEMSDTEFEALLERAIETAKNADSAISNPLDDPDNPDVPKGGRWGVTGMGQTPEQFRTRVGVPGLNKSPSGRVKAAEAEKLAQRIDQVQPDEVIGFSRGAATFNAAKATGKMKSDPKVLYMAPSSYRAWSDAPVPAAPSGSRVTIGDKDTLVPMKQAAKTAVAAGAPMYVLPGYSHVGIMYSKGDVTPGGFEVDPQAIVSDSEMPDWGRVGVAKGGKNGPVIKGQAERVKQHVKERRMVAEFVRLLLSR